MKIANKTNKSSTTIIIGVFLAAIIIIFLIFLLSGEVKTTGKYPEDQHTNSLLCLNTNNIYPFFVYDNSYKKETTIKAVFDINSKIQTISLIHSLYYLDDTSFQGSESQNHAAMNKNFGDSELEPDALNANYYRGDKVMRMSLYASQKEITKTSAKFLLIDEFLINDSTDIQKYQANYEKKGFKCNTEYQY